MTPFTPEELAQRLYNALKVKRIVSSRYSQKAWQKELEWLCSKHETQRVEMVLSWYCSHIGEEFVPQANSAIKFRLKFPQIVAAMERSDSSPSEQVSTINQARADRLANDLPWPVEIKTKLPTLVQRTATNWINWMAKIHAFRISKSSFTNKTDRWGRFLLEIVVDTHHFVDQWFLLLSTKYGRMEHYIGPVLSLAFKPESQMFKNSFWREWSARWTGDPTTFDPLLVELLQQQEKP